MNADNHPALFIDRETWLVDIRKLSGWQLKVYGIVANNCKLAKETIESALTYVDANVVWPVHNGPKFGFVTIHAGEQAVWLLVDVWVDEIMHHFLYRAPVESPAEFGAGPQDATTACVWELAVTCHERNAWVRRVLSNPPNPGFQEYLEDCLEINVN